jgi:hypothetical protein
VAAKSQAVSARLEIGRAGKAWFSGRGLLFHLEAGSRIGRRFFSGLLRKLNDKPQKPLRCLCGDISLSWQQRSGKNATLWHWAVASYAQGVALQELRCQGTTKARFHARAGTRSAGISPVMRQRITPFEAVEHYRRDAGAIRLPAQVQCGLPAEAGSANHGRV